MNRSAWLGWTESWAARTLAVAPVRIASLMMGVWFLGASVGNFIGGRLASFYEAFPLPNLFAVVAGFGIVFGVLMLAFSKTIKGWMGEVK